MQVGSALDAHAFLHRLGAVAGHAVQRGGGRLEAKGYGVAECAYGEGVG